MTKYTKETLKTTTDCVEAAQELKEKAKKVRTRSDHAAWWDEKVDFIKFVNGLLETGGFEGKAYDELMTSKSIIYYAETRAGEEAMKHGAEF